MGITDEEFDSELARIGEIAGTEPPNQNIFEFKYKARGELTALRTKVVDAAKETPKANGIQEKAARVHIIIASSMFETEEFAEGYEYLERAEDVFQHLRRGEPYDWSAPFKKDQLLECRTSLGKDDDGRNYDYADNILEVFNTAGYCWSSRQDTEKALKALRHSEAVYQDWDAWARRHGDTGVLNVEDDGKVAEGATPIQKQRAKVEAHYTNTCFYFAQVFGNQAKTPEAIKYVHLTISSQLLSKREFDRIEWATNALGLCNFHLNQNDYGAARYALQAAEKVLAVVAPELRDDEQFNQTTARMHLAFAKWHIYWMKHWKEAQEGLMESDEPALPSKPVQERVDWWVDFNLDIPPPSLPEPIGPPGEGWSEALRHFKEARRRLRAAQEWFVFDGFVTDYIAIQQDFSTLFRYLVHWDQDAADPFGRQIDRHCALYEQRLKVLEYIPGEISEKHYLNYQRQVWFECAETLMEVSEWRQTQRENRDKIAKGQALKRKAINKITLKAKDLFFRFAETFKDRDGTMPNNLDPDVCGAYVSARMHVARLDTKMLADSAKEEYDFIETSLRNYNEIVNWVDQHPDKKRVLAERATSMQIDMAREMTRLLPGKMNEVRKAFMRLC
eukprot:Hpha_TRINITY_DN16657_c0_g1::TRINITY_DN16657_c0_g1_i1::g.178431::m.178431